MSHFEICNTVYVCFHLYYSYFYVRVLGRDNLSFLKGITRGKELFSSFILLLHPLYPL